MNTCIALLNKSQRGRNYECAIHQVKSVAAYKQRKFFKLAFCFTNKYKIQRDAY